MGFILELLFEIVFNFVLQLFGELLFEVVLRFIPDFLRGRVGSALLALVGYAAAGMALGGLSLLVFPGPLMVSKRFHGISLLVSPLLAGAAMAGLGWLRRRQGKRVLRLDSFGYGAAFAFAFALVRFLFTA